MTASTPTTARRLLTAAFAYAAATAAAAPEEPRDWSVHVDLQSTAVSSPYDSWLEGGLGKLRYDESGDGLDIGRIFLVYDKRLKPTVSAHAVVDYVADGSPGIDFTEAFLKWRPVPKSEYRHELKAGFFYPPLSLENDGPGWSNVYSITNSAINTWIAEELRVLGAEWRLSRRIGQPETGQSVAFTAAAFAGNDPAGTLLAWKGWGLHDRQTRFDDVLPLPPLPQIGPGGMFSHQAVQGEPFIETDDRPGYYVGAEWRRQRRALVGIAHYDNHANPQSLRRGQYGWTTVFDHLAVQLNLPAGFGLAAQWMDGSTVMGPIIDGARAVDTSFASSYVLLTKAVERHRITVRYDDFTVVDNDAIPLDENDDSGHAWTLAYRFERSDSLAFGAEWLQVSSAHPSAVYLGMPAAATERMLNLVLSYRLGP